MLILPIATDRYCRQFPYVTVALIVINTLVLALEFTADAASVLRWAFTPAHPSLITIFTSTFMHAGLFHLLGNMLFLWVFGSVVEDALGPLVYGLFYLCGGLAAGMMHWVVTATLAPDQAMIPSLGASGAVSAILAIFAARFYRNKVRIFWMLGIWLRGSFEVPSLWPVGIYFALDLFHGLTDLGSEGGVANWAHIGGFLFGLAMGFAMRSPQDAAQEYALDEARTSLAVMAPGAAIDRLLPIVRGNPENEEARVQLARSFEFAGDEASADEQWRSVLRQRLRQRRRAEVVELCRQVPRSSLLGGMDPRSLYDIACCFEESFQFEEAARLLQRVWQEQPHAPEAELAMLRQATVLKERLRHPAADQLFDQFLTRFPHSQYRAYAAAKKAAGS